MPEAADYRITILSVEDESLFVSPPLKVNAWTIPPDLRSRLKPGTVYHWQLTVTRQDGLTERSDAAAFAMQEIVP